MPYMESVKMCFLWIIRRIILLSCVLNVNVSRIPSHFWSSLFFFCAGWLFVNLVSSLSLARLVLVHILPMRRICLTFGRGSNRKSQHSRVTAVDRRGDCWQAWGCQSFWVNKGFGGCRWLRGDSSSFLAIPEIPAISYILAPLDFLKASWSFCLIFILPTLPNVV